MTFLTFKYRIKDSSDARHLARYAIACNQVWNFCVATTREAQRRHRRWPTAFDLINLCAGSSAELGILADSISEVCSRFVAARAQHRRCPSFRASFGAKRALGWTPFKGRAVSAAGCEIRYLKRRFHFWDSRPWEGNIKTGAFVEDARGRWYVTFNCEVADNLPAGNGEIGIDLGLKALATCSDGTEIPAMQHYRKYEAALAKAQRAGRRRRARAIHAKIANSRRHHLHVASTKLANANSLIVVGDVNAATLKRAGMGKSISDAGWSAFRHMLRYKLARRQGAYVEADERYSSQACSECGSLSGPKGRKALGVRHWDCADCGASHHRDVNAAKLILASGRNVALQRTGNARLHGH